MKLTRLLLGFVLSSGLLLFAACGSSDSKDENPFGGGGSGGGGGGSGGGGAGGSITTSGNWSCTDVMTCSSGKLQACCTATQCKYVIGSKEYPCTTQTNCTSAAESAVAACM